MQRIPLMATIFLLVLNSVVFAVPGIPNRVYGTVSFIDGQAPDGSIVEAKIDGATVASTATHNGIYGYIPNVFDINDPNNNLAGKQISFFVNGIDTGKTATFTNGKASELNLVVNEYVNKNKKINEQVTSTPSASTGWSITQTSTSNKSCTSSWYCSDWSSCSDDFQTRKCVDINYCAIPTSKPVLTQDCDKPTAVQENNVSPISGTTTTAPEEVKQQYTPTGLVTSSNSVGIIATILVLVAIIMYVRKKRLDY